MLSMACPPSAPSTYLHYPEEKGLSYEEFAVFQHQLIALREEKYALEGERNRSLLRVGQLEDKLRLSEEKLRNYYSLMSRMKRSEPLQALVLENQELCQKVNMAESNFLLQIDTLNKECEHLMSENQKLTEQLNSKRNNSRSDNQDLQKESVHSSHSGDTPSEEVVVLKKELSQLHCRMLNIKAEEEANAKQQQLSVQQQVQYLKDNHLIAVTEMRDKLQKLETALEKLTNELQEANAREGTLQTTMTDSEIAHQSKYTELQVQTDLQIREVRDTMNAQLTAKDDELQLTLKDAHEAEDCAEKSRETLLENCDSLRSNQLSIQKKYDRQLRDLKRDYNKEVRFREELQATLVELRAHYQRLIPPGAFYGLESRGDKPGSISSLTSHDFLPIRLENGLSHSSRGDGGSSQQSLMASSLLDAEENASALLETDLTDVINRLVETQDDNCSLRRKSESLQRKVDLYHEQILSKDAIIHRYMNPQTYLIPSPTATSSIASALSSITPRIKHSDNFEFRQLRNLCEELMTRNLQLEESLSLALHKATDNGNDPNDKAASVDDT